MMVNEHDFKKFPELTDTQMELLYHKSPHRQILEDFQATVTKVIDGDTLELYWKGRDFTFPLRMLDINAPEMNEPQGKEVQSWLELKILDKKVDIVIDPKQRVGKWGRLLGKVIHRGLDIGEFMMILGKVTSFEARDEGTRPRRDQWL